MGILSNLFASKNKLDSKLKNLLDTRYIQKNGLYRNVDGSIPILEDFLAQGFSVDDYFKLVHGTSQTELQNKVLLPSKANRQYKLNVMSKRLATSASKPKKMNKSNLSAPTAAVNSFAMFAPFGIYNAMALNGVNGVSSFELVNFLSTTSNEGFYFDKSILPISDDFSGIDNLHAHGHEDLNNFSNSFDDNNSF